MAFRVIVVLIALFAGDAYFWHGYYTQLTIDTAQHFAANFNNQVARRLPPLH
jgi:hypothetical protein